MPDVEIKPVAVRRIFGQDVTSIEVGEDTLLLHTRRGDVQVDLHSSTLESSPSWIVLKRLVLNTSAGAFGLDGITSGDVETIQQAIQEAQRRKVLLTSLLADSEKVCRASAAWDELAARDAYLTSSDAACWVQGVEEHVVPGAADLDLIDRLPDNHARALRRLITLRADPQKAADQRNERYALRHLQEFKGFFDAVESQPLTEQQRRAVVHDEDNALVIAGAGTGKTSTIVAKVGFVLKKGWAKPEEVLLLAFTQKSAEEMRERLKKRLGVELHVRTFHAPGLEIVATARGAKPSLCAEAEDPAVKRQTLENLIAKQLADEKFRRDYLAFQARLRQPFRAAWEFNSESEYVQYLLDVEPRALTGRRMKSYEECEIANWLLLNGVRAEYETPYEVNTETAEHRQYKPDFYLPDYGIYIEHWGVDRADRTARFVDQERYRAKMAWARDTHQKNNTKLVETYSWERQENVLLTSLETKLRAHGVELRAISMDAALDILNEAGRTEPFVNLVGTFLSHFKSAGWSSKDLQAKIGQSGDGARNALFFRLFEKLYAEYEALIHGRGEIDFEDMIGMARGHVDNGSYRSPFRYILVDEFQDIAPGRANLIQSLRKQVPGSKLFCVGDDWQSIYRFTGSNIVLTTDFEKHFGFTKKTSLDRTFRFHDKLSEFSSRFVQKNPGQLRKQLTTNTTSTTPGVVVFLQEGTTDALSTALAELDAQGQASVLVLGRYRHTIPKDGELAALRRAYSRLDIRAMTAHASKGLEADYVVVCEVNQGRYGFPSEIADDPVLAMVLPESEQFPFAEERRLFYVALTRARKRVYLIADATNPSAFIREILAEEGYEKAVVGASSSASNVCPLCKRGEVTKRTSEFGEFFSCSNYPICTYKGTTCPRCKRGWMRPVDEKDAHCSSCDFPARRCPRCRDGVLVQRWARSGGRPPFYGCSNYGRSIESCDYTERM